MWGHPLVGRGSELGVLRDAVERARAGRGGAVALVGEPGIGKSRLAAELAEGAARDGMGVAWGRCWEAGGAPAGWPWRELLLALSRDDAWPAALAGLGSRGRWIGTLAPELTDAPSASSPQDRFHVADALRELLRGMSEARPWLLVLEDLHAADTATLELLAPILRTLGDLAVLVLATWRDADGRARAEAAPLLDAAARAAAVVRISPLGPEDAQALARDALGDAATDEAIAAIGARAGGNPLFVEELARAGASGAPVVGLGEAIRSHLARLDPDALELARAAAVLGRTAELGPLRRMANADGALTDETFEAARGALARAAVWTVDGPRATFRHILVRDALHDATPVERRRVLHARALDALADVGAPASELAHHALAAAPLVSIDVAAQHARRAAAEARRALDYETSTELLERALERLEGSDAPPDAARVELSIELAESAMVLGRVDRARAICVRAAALAERLGEPELLGRAALAYGMEYTLGTQDRQMVDLLERALAALGEADGAMRARVLARYGTALYPHRDMRVPVEVAEDALAMARRLGDEQVLFEVLDRGRLPLVLTRPVREWAPLEEECGSLVERHGDARQQLVSRAFRVFGRVSTGDVEGARAVLAEAEELAERFATPQQRFRVRLLRSMLANHAGRFEESAGHVEAVRQMLEGRPLAAAVDVVSFHRLGAARTRRDVEWIHARREELSTKLAGYPNGAGIIPWIHAVLGDRDACRAAIELRASRLWGRPVAIHVLLAEAAAFVGDDALLDELYGLLSPRAGETIVWGSIAMTAEGTVDGTLAHIAAARGDLARAEAHFRTACALEEERGSRPWLAHRLLDWADALIAAGGAAWRAEAREHALRAAEIYDAIGLDARAAEARARIETQVETTDARSGASAPASGSTPRFSLEGDVVTVAFDGSEVRVKDAKGLRYLAHLVERPGEAVSAVDVAALDGGPLPEAFARSDAGSVIDEKAKRAYRKRAAELREALEEAEDRGDARRAARAREELEALEDHLRAALGLGGRARKAGAVAERARINVQRRIRAAIGALGKQSPALADHLERSIRTGAFCTYDPPAERAAVG